MSEIEMAVSDLMSAAIRLNRHSFTVAVTFSGHVDRLLIVCYPGGWHSGAESIKILDEYIAGALANPHLVQILRSAKQRLIGLGGISCQNCGAGPSSPANATPLALAAPQRKKRSLSPEQREAAAERMRQRWAEGKMRKKPA